MHTSNKTSVVILCGGRAVRMGQYFAAVSKPMLPVAGKPFLEWLVEGLLPYVREIVLVTGTHCADLCSHFDNALWLQRYVRVLVEPAALGTGGALRLGAGVVSSPEVLVTNADTIVSGFSVVELGDYHSPEVAPITMVLGSRSNQNQGLILVQDGFVVASLEPPAASPGPALVSVTSWSAAGVYMFDRVFVLANVPERLSSLERDLLPGFIKRRLVRAFTLEMSVHDFGTPERYESLRSDPAMLNNMFGRARSV